MKLQTIVKPIITEKSMIEAANGRFTFEVDKKASKGEIQRSIEEVFGVAVVDIRTTKISGKRRRVGRLRREITRPDGKKAIVRLKKGQKIDVFEIQG